MEIMSMTQKERTEWLLQIQRIETELRNQRFLDSQDEIERILKAKDEFMEQ